MIKTLLSLETFGKQSHDWHTPWTWSQIFFLAIKNCSGVTYFLWCSIVCLSQVKGNVQKLNKHSCMSRFSSLSYSLWQVFFSMSLKKWKWNLAQWGTVSFTVRFIWRVDYILNDTVVTADLSIHQENQWGPALP